MSKLGTFTAIAKGASYLGLALNQLVKLAAYGTRQATDIVIDRKRYTIELLVDGATIKTKTNQTGNQLSKTVRMMNDVGIDRAVITEMNKDIK
jgi:vacuolar-type H+-ATPase subunit D/Vma8|tara:strand:+ start:2115 stop:2393 length:279 start_codon:yes stop_codon:yes gene_type:complete